MKSAVNELIAQAKAEVVKNNIESSWNFLAEAHIISQPDAFLHTKVHWEMFKLAIKTHDLSEQWGQLLRLIVAAPGSWSGKYPLGNTGRSNVSMFKVMEIPDALRDKMGHKD